MPVRLWDGHDPNDGLVIQASRDCLSAFRAEGAVRQVTRATEDDRFLQKEDIKLSSSNDIDRLG